ncbi:ferredoxin--NADP reductase [Gallaecimonas xiamenensis]|uniref:Flavodoxin/ferredoxin--NADP reductase n=1 Tax=Gallaecimonas xiamenensis 3-C-1 TaxID=745411 RepID=K2JFQ9_9GAMM|nr:ferredoxin--NADP reductase [Gallaecimonas xiamenensis]EKE69494.1 ferredoxin-NADP reductase [Gallaecimonas xiamenensis 3-C-1]
MAQWLSAKVVENHQWNPTLFSLRVETPPFDFVAGQFVRLALEGPQGRAQRAYSLVNSPGSPYLDFLVTPVPQGKLSPQLHLLKAGDSLEVSQPASGFFVLDEVPDGKSLWLLATGTGLGPYLSMLGTEVPWRRFERIHLVHGVRWQQDLAYKDQIEALVHQHPQLRYQPVITREAVPGALGGRLPALIASGELEAALGDQLNIESQLMLCGNPDMIRDSLATLAQKGLNKNLRRQPGHVTVEQYW